MKFTPIQRRNSGTKSALTGSETVSRLNLVDLTFATKFYPEVVAKNTVDESDINPVLQITWYYWIYKNQTEIFEFHAMAYYSLTEIEKEATDEDLKQVIKHSYKSLMNQFDPVREQYRAFSPITEINSANVLEQIPILKEELNLLVI